MGPSVRALQAMRDNLERTHYYPFNEQTALALGIGFFLSKPVAPELLLTTVAEALA